ncbi:hypothetical protein D3C79_919260 [compost metagenome]
MRTVAGDAGHDRTRWRQAGAFPRVDGARHVRQPVDRRGLAGWGDALHLRRLVDIDKTHALHCIEVIEVTPEFLEAVGCRQRFEVVAQVVLAELTGGIAQIQQKFGQRWCARTQP